MKTKRFLSLVVALAMVLAFVPAMASAAAEEQVLFDTANLTITGEQNLDQGGWTAAGNGADVKWNQNWGDNGVWGSQGTYALMFFFTNQRGTGDGSAEAIINSAAGTKGAEKISIDFNFACQEVADLYQRWNFKDNDGNTFATFYFDKNVRAEVGNTATSIAATGADVLAMRGQAINITATKNAEGKYDVAYTVNGNLVTTDTVESINGFKSIQAEVYSWNQQWAAAGLQNLKISYIVPETMKEVKVTYTVDGAEVASETKTYDTSKETGAAFPAKNYSLNGTNVFYRAEAEVVADSKAVEMTKVQNTGAYSIGDSISHNGKLYNVTSANLIPNADFAYGIDGWYAADGNAALSANFTADSAAGSIKTLHNAGSGDARSLQRSWAIEANKTYAFIYTHDKAENDDGKKWQRFSLGNDFANNNNAMLSGAGAGDVETGQSVVAGTNTVVFTNTDGYAYANFRAGYNGGTTFSNFGLYEVEENLEAQDATVVYKKADGTVVRTVTKKTTDSVTVPASEVFFTDGGYYTLPETTVAAGETKNVEIIATPNKYGVLEDALVSDNEIWGIKKTNENSVFVAAGADVNRAPLTDADGTPLRGSNDPSTLGKSRVGFVEFPVVDLAEGQKAIAHFYVRAWHGNGFSNGNNSLRVAAYVVNDSSWTALSDGGKYDSANAPILASYPNAIFSDVNYRTEDLTFDVTDAMKAAKAAGLEKFDLRLNSAWGAAYIAEREAAVEGGAYEGKAAYIAVEDAGAYVVTTTGAELSKNGSNVGTSATVTADDTLKYCSKEVYLNDTKEILPKGTAVAATGATEINATKLDSFGIALKDGAQVRLGEGALGEDNKIDATKSSGIRFIGEVTSAEDSYYAVAEDFGIAVAADGSFDGETGKTFEEVCVTIPATNMQNETVFTAAIVNLNSKNYNRAFIAKPYVVINGVTYFDTIAYESTSAVARSIYQVASGLLTTEGELDENTSEGVLNILNAYVNMTGARLTFDETAGVAAAEYANGAPAFFTATRAEGETGNTYTITLKANGKAKFFDYWNEFYRVNNSHTDFAASCSPVASEVSADGTTVTLTFTVTPAAE